MPSSTPEPPVDAHPTAGGAQAPPVPGPASTVGWLVIFCLARAAFSMVHTTYAASLPLLKVDWAMSAGEAGLVASAFNIGFLVSLFSVGFLADRFGARRTYLATSLAAAASALAFAAFARDFTSGFLLYGLTGLCSGGSYTPGLNLLAERYDARRRGRAIGFYIAASSAGYAVSLLMSSLMLRFSGWHAAFWATACGPLAGMLLGAWALRGVPNVPAPPAPRRGGAGPIAAVVRNKAAVLMILGYVFHSWELLGLWAWIPFFLSVSYGGGDATTVAASMGAVFSALSYAISVGGPIVGGSLSDRLGRTAVIIGMATASVVCSFSIGWLVAAPFGLVVALALVYQFTSLGDSPVLSVSLSELVEHRTLGAAYSLRSVLGFGAGAVSPWLFGVVLDWGRGAQAAPSLTWGLAFSLLGLGGLFAPLSIAWLRRLPDSARMAGGKR
jgi:MFS family permease